MDDHAIQGQEGSEWYVAAEGGVEPVVYYYGSSTLHLEGETGVVRRDRSHDPHIGELEQGTSQYDDGTRDLRLRLITPSQRLQRPFYSNQPVHCHGDNQVSPAENTGRHDGEDGRTDDLMFPHVQNDAVDVLEGPVPQTDGEGHRVGNRQHAHVEITRDLSVLSLESDQHGHAVTDQPDSAQHGCGVYGQPDTYLKVPKFTGSY